MNGSPRSQRIHIGIVGRVNSGKSSVLNLITGQKSSIVSPVPGTTSDPVRKSMELHPLGPVVFMDSAGLDEESRLGPLRFAKSMESLASSDIVILVSEAGKWGDEEEIILHKAITQKSPVIVISNKSDLGQPDNGQAKAILQAGASAHLSVSCKEAEGSSAIRAAFMQELVRALVAACPESLIHAPSLLGGIFPETEAGLRSALLVTPIDSAAPKGRLIMPQVETIRAALDMGLACSLTRETEYAGFLGELAHSPDIVICDSRLAALIAAQTPHDSLITSFSILFSRAKGDIIAMAKGAGKMMGLEKGSRVLIAEACSHHAQKDDIGTVKIPQWLRGALSEEIGIEHTRGRDYPENLGDYNLVIHCGACTLTRREMLQRIQKADEAGVPVTNYGLAISAFQGVLPRMLSPFPEALEAWAAAGGQL